MALALPGMTCVAVGVLDVVVSTKYIVVAIMHGLLRLPGVICIIYPLSHLQTYSLSLLLQCPILTNGKKTGTVYMTEMLRNSKTFHSITLRCSNSLYQKPFLLCYSL